MKNLFLLPTDKPSRLIKSQDNDFVYLNINAPNWFEINLKTTKQNIYITNDEDINENDYIITKDGRLVQVSYLLSKDLEGASKVILTTDQDLIKDGVQAIDDEFLQWFVKNPSCESVELEKWTDYKFENDKEVVFFNHKIIIPKEEPKQDMKQTAVQWLEEQTRKPEWHSLKRGELFDQAKEMEKQQIIDAFEKGNLIGWREERDVEGKQYYNETFNK